jgi:pimeloyl-ACP methyl ester carboxylesterase
MATFVLVPGFWLGAWAWEDVTRELTAAGHDAHPVTLTGLAERAAEATPQVNLDTHIADVVRIVQARDLHDVVLVAHSGGNMPVTGAADRLAGRIARIVYVDTGPMPSGMASIDFHDPQAQQRIRDQVAEQGGGWLLPVPPFDAAADPVNLAGLTGPQLATLRGRGTPQPFAPVVQPLFRPEEPAQLPGSMIATTFSPDQVRAMAASGNPIFARMTALDLHHLPTGHWPMFSRPAELAALLAKIAS